MPKFSISVKATSEFNETFEVEANDLDAAKSKAEAKMDLFLWSISRNDTGEILRSYEIEAE